MLEGQNENLPQCHVAGIIEGWYADGDGFLWHLEAAGSVQEIPSRKETRPVAVRLLNDIRMMDAMHARRDDQQDEQSFDARRQADVRVMKEDRGEEDRLPQP